MEIIDTLERSDTLFSVDILDTLKTLDTLRNMDIIDTLQALDVLGMVYIIDTIKKMQLFIFRTLRELKQYYLLFNNRRSRC